MHQQPLNTHNKAPGALSTCPATIRRQMLLDAAGLALFAVAATEKALDYKIHPFMAAFLGAVTGVGGATIRDIFLARVLASL